MQTSVYIVFRLLYRYIYFCSLSCSFIYTCLLVLEGIQAFGWTELIRDKDTLEHMLFPRLLALAERAWHRGEWENTTVEPARDWERFTNKLGYRELPRLDSQGVNYRVPVPGAA